MGRGKPQRVQNQFGGNIGGPIARDRAFFFFDYEGTRIRQGVLRIATVPLAIEKAGNFSANLGSEILVGGQKVPILNPDGTPSGQFVRQGQLFDPRAQVANPLFNSTQPVSVFNPQFIRQPFAGNIIGNIDSTAAKLAALYPSPTLSGRANNFARTPSLADDQDRLITRIDYRLNSRNDIFGRYAFTKRNRFVPGFFGGIPDGTDTSAWGDSDIKSHSVTIGWNRIISSTIVNQFRFGYSRSNADTVQDRLVRALVISYRVPNNSEVQATSGDFDFGFSQGLVRPTSSKFQHSEQFQYTIL